MNPFKKNKENSESSLEDVNEEKGNASNEEKAVKPISNDDEEENHIEPPASPDDEEEELEEQEEKAKDPEEELGTLDPNEKIEIAPEDATKPEYDHLWQSEVAFQEKNFAENFAAPRKCVDIVWTIIFYINFIVSLVLLILAKPWEEPEEYGAKAREIPHLHVITIGLICILIALCICFLTYIFIVFFPRVYIKASMIIGLVILLGTMIPLMILLSIWIIFLAGVVFVVCFLFFCSVCTKMNFSGDVLRSAALIIRKFPSVFFFNLGMFVVQSVLSYAFSCGALLVFARGISYWVYVYVIISYFWIVQTINYVAYMSCAGVAISWYFLNETEYMPAHPLAWSFLHAITSNFGGAALAGLMEGITNAFRWIKKKGETLACCAGGCCFKVLECCCKCFIKVVGCFIGIVNRYSLCYSCMFGVPITEGVKRWKSLSKKKIIDMLINATIIDKTFGFYSYVAGICGGSIGGLIGMHFYGKGSAEMNFCATMATTCALNGLLLISKPLECLSDALFIGFAEAPLRLETGAKEIYNLFSGKCKKILDEEIAIAKGEKKPRKWYDCFGCCNKA